MPYKPFHQLISTCLSPVHLFPSWPHSQMSLNSLIIPSERIVFEDILKLSIPYVSAQGVILRPCAYDRSYTPEFDTDLFQPFDTAISKKEKKTNSEPAAASASSAAYSPPWAAFDWRRNDGGPTGISEADPRRNMWKRVFSSQACLGAIGEPGSAYGRPAEYYRQYAYVFRADSPLPAQHDGTLYIPPGQRSSAPRTGYVYKDPEAFSYSQTIPDCCQWRLLSLNATAILTDSQTGAEIEGRSAVLTRVMLLELSDRPSLYDPTDLPEVPLEEKKRARDEDESRDASKSSAPSKRVC
jgi:hypothetical protein